MGEFRRDPLTGGWVIVNVRTPWRPEQYGRYDNVAYGNEFSPFIYGNEYLMPLEIDSFCDEGEQGRESQWVLRVIPHKFPVFSIGGVTDVKQGELYTYMDSVGAHEIVVETADPVKQMNDFSDNEMRLVLLMYQRRYGDLTKDTRFQYISIFKDFGKLAGASFSHAYSQLIALPIVPTDVLDKLRNSAQYKESTDKNIFQMILDRERRDGVRIVDETQNFLVFCPFASRYPFEMCIFPKDVGSHYATLNDHELLDLGIILKRSLNRLKSLFNNPAFNYYFQLDPVNNATQDPFLWHISIVPKLNTFLECDGGGGFFSLQTSPEVAAKYLRGAFEV